MKKTVAALACALSFATALASPIQTDVSALKDVFAGEFKIGCLLSYRHVGFPDDPAVPGQSPVIERDGGALIARHMNSMSPGNNMKLAYTFDADSSARNAAAAKTDAERAYAETHPVIRFNGDLVAQLDWAKRRGFTFRGHTLVWHSSAPARFFLEGYAAGAPRASRETVAARMEFYVAEVMRLIHEGWPNLLSAMDVVNEAVDDAGESRTYESPWRQAFGDDSYVRLAFEFAKKYRDRYGEGQMKLYYNDYNTHLPRKAKAIARLCAPLHEAGLLDGIGMQEHDDLDGITAKAWIAGYETLEAACDEIAITEFDVALRTNEPNGVTLARQANVYAALFKCFLDRSAGSGRGKIVSVSKDGLNDALTFKANAASSIWDANNQCKPAFYEIVAMAQNYRALTDEIAKANAAFKNAAFTGGAIVNAELERALKGAKAALDANYASMESPSKALGAALAALRAAE